MLSSHGPFSSKSIHQHAKPETDKHMKNMEAIAEGVRQCVLQASFGCRQLMCYRGIKAEDYVFADGEQLQGFLSLSEDGKKQDFSSEYITDRETIRNELFDGIRTPWLDKHTAYLYIQQK